MLVHLERLPVPQRDALRTALGISPGSAPDRFLVALARRLQEESVGLVFAARKPSDDVAGLPELVLEGLREGDARTLLDSVLTGPLDVRVRDRIVAETHGNPLALLELPPGLTPAELAGGFGLAGMVPLAGRIEDSFRRRLEGLPEEMSREELIGLVRRQDGQITTLSTQVADLLGVNEDLVGKLARLAHLLSRNSANSSMPPFKDEDPGRTPPPDKPKRPAGPKRKRGKQPGAPGANLAWVERPDDRWTGSRKGGASAAMTWARRPIWGSWIATSSTRSRRSACASRSTTNIRCVAVAARSAPPSAPKAPASASSGTAPNLQSFAVCLMVVHFVPAQRCVELLESLTGARPQRRVRARHTQPRVHTVG
jgi:hypothetical protein